MEDYEALLKESTSVAIERFPSIYNELLAVLKDGKTPLYYAFHVSVVFFFFKYFFILI